MDPLSIVPLKLSAADPAKPLSPRGTQVFRIDVWRDEELHPCVLKVAGKDIIELEVRSLLWRLTGVAHCMTVSLHDNVTT